MSHRGIKALKASKTKARTRRETALAKAVVKEPAEHPEEKRSYASDYDEENLLFKAYYEDSLYGLRLNLRRDGRRRGLWVNLEEDRRIRSKRDLEVWEEALEDLMPVLAKLFSKKEVDPLDVRMAIRLHMGWFFDHRTEGLGMRLTWPQVRKFIAALTAREKEEKNKTEDWDYSDEADE